MSVTLSPPLPAEQRPEDRQWTVEEFHRAASAGAFRDPGRLEIIHGRIVEKMPEGGRHTGLRRRIARRLRAALEPDSFVCEECPLRIAFDGEPIPDVMFTREEDYGDQHPTSTDVVLLIEVSDSTAAYDLGGKSALYAQAGIGDYWVVLVNEAAIVRHRGPSPDGYQEVTRLAGDDTISPLVAPEAVWTVNALLGREEASEEN
jgi:Uma2 family endonuclease